MGKIKKAATVKLVCSFFYSDASVFQRTKDACCEIFGKTDYESAAIPFTHTGYYEKEFGKNLMRNFASFKHLVMPDALADIKITTNEIEEKLKDVENRAVNIDPGYVALSKLVLATTKDYVHRIYVGKGMYAEVTLYFKDGTFQSFPWTYPDYKTPEIVSIFNNIRMRYKQQLMRSIDKSR